MPRTQHTDRYKQLCGRLLDGRKKAGLTQEELARKLGKPQSYVSKFESGERRLDVIELLDVAGALQITVSSLTRGL